MLIHRASFFSYGTLSINLLAAYVVHYLLNPTYLPNGYGDYLRMGLPEKYQHGAELHTFIEHQIAKP